MIIPSIDISNNKIVQLKQGNEIIIEEEDIDKVINKYKYFSQVNLIDIDRAKGNGENKKLIKYICSKLNCNIGGGIRDEVIAEEYLNSNAKSIIVGTKANIEFLSKLPKEKVIVALDTKDGKLAIKGWQELQEFSLEGKIKELENYCNGFLITNVNVEGLNQGVDIEYIQGLKGISKKRIIVAGGITTLSEIKKINSYGFDQVLGLAVSSGNIDIVDAFLETIDFEKQELIPTIVQDISTNEVLMMAYSNRESIIKTFKTGYGTYYSRSRKQMWKKGETSRKYTRNL